MTTAPTTMRGYLDDQLTFAWGSLVADTADHVPDMLWPASMDVFRQMRRHPQLAAVLAAHSLPIRRAASMLNPAGCRDEVVQLVADDFGLPVAGQDQPGAARVRGVSWADHIRLALLNLPYGHSGFEMLAEIRDGRARLVELSERLPTTIAEINVDKVGRFAGVTQHMYAGKRVPQIRADQMVWYAREREGAAWWGQSLLRPAYPAWLLSREMLRVTATGHRRFSVGVPTGEWDAGVNPSPAQHTDLQRAMSSARVGEQGGMALPPGAHMKLIGLTGSVPDTLAFIRYLDQTMARMALAGFLDLGTTETGSRALAGEFIDLFLLAIQAEADAIADTATRQVAARLVEWNWGTDEPVPAVQIADVGSRHEVTAEALNLLLGSGALSADPALEAHIRRQYKLPEREGMVQPAPSVAGDTLTSANPRPGPDATGQPDPALPADTVAAANRKTRRKAPAVGQLTLPIAADADLDDMELPIAAAFGYDPRAILDELNAAVDGFRGLWPSLAAPMTAGLVADVGAALAGGVGGLASLAVGAGAVAALGTALGGAMVALAGRAARRAAGEVSALGVRASPGSADDGALHGRADVTAGLVAQTLAGSATRAAMLHAGRDVDAVTAAVQADLDRLLELKPGGYLLQNLESALAAAQASGRMATFAQVEDRVQLMANETNDASACTPCDDINGKVFRSFAAAAEAYPAGRFFGCLGGDRCRGHLQPVARA